LSKTSAFAPLLYIVAETPDGPCKVGYGSHPNQRLIDLQIGNPRQLVLASVWQCSERSSKQCERLLHHILAKQSMRGEWFNASVADIEAICISQGMHKSNGYDYSRKPTASDTRLSWLIQ
jgi:hypothetical protein